METPRSSSVCRKASCLVAHLRRCVGGAVAWVLSSSTPPQKKGGREIARALPVVSVSPAVPEKTSPRSPASRASPTPQDLAQAWAHELRHLPRAARIRAVAANRAVVFLIQKLEEGCIVDENSLEFPLALCKILRLAPQEVGIEPYLLADHQRRSKYAVRFRHCVKLVVENRTPVAHMMHAAGAQ